MLNLGTMQFASLKFAVSNVYQTSDALERGKSTSSRDTSLGGCKSQSVMRPVR